MGSKGLALAVAFLCTAAMVTAQPSPNQINGNEQLPEEPNDILSSTIDRGELFEGDLKLSSDTVRQFYDLNSLPTTNSDNCGSCLLAVKDNVSQKLGEHLTMWPEGVIHYLFDPSISVSLACTVREAMDEWQQATCLHFTSRDPEVMDGSSTSYVNFTAISGGGCYSDSVGMKGGQQVVNLGNSGCQTCGEIMHLIGHVVGLWHEQSRPDRDDYLLIVPENIKEGRRQDFMRLKGSGKEYGASDLLYDYGSIMHYGLSAYSACENSLNVCPTIAIRNPKEYREQGYTTVGQRVKLGEGDIQKVMMLYGGTDSGCPPALKKGRITVYIDRAFNLPFTSDTPDAYVIISAIAVSPDGMIMEALMHTTSTRRDLQHPVWDELLDLGGREWMLFFRIEVWDSNAGTDKLISIPEEIMIDRIHMERTHCINPGCHGYIRYTYSFSEDGDECLPNPCQNSGKCIDGISSYTCSCPPAWTGTNCHIRLACYDEPCPSYEMCNEQINYDVGTSSYTCSCPPGLTGTNCHIRLACYNNPCQNGGTCNEHTNHNTGISTYTCSCPQDWFGKNCQFMLACGSQPCENGGTCTNYNLNHITGTSTYTCSCWWKWIGNNCQFSRPCSLRPCENGGKCTDHITNYAAGAATYSCDCLYGWIGSTCATRYTRLRVYVRDSAGLLDVDHDSVYDLSDPYVKVTAYDHGGYQSTQYTGPIWNDLSPEWYVWLDFGVNDWYKFIIQVRHKHGSALSSPETVYVSPDSNTINKHYCYSGYIRYDYEF